MLQLRKKQKRIAALAAILLLVGMLAGCFAQPKEQGIPVRVLVLPKFEAGELTGDFPGEAQLFYEAYLAGGEVYEINGHPEPGKLYYKDGVAMYLLGQGKVSAALNTTAVLSDPRFDFSDAYILPVGCGGSAEGYGIFGDVYVISAAVDYDLGHHADAREMQTESDTTWFCDDSFEESAVVRLNPDLTDRVFNLIKDVPLETTEQTANILKKAYPGEAWADRQPQILRGTAVTGDNFWKGKYDHQNALRITETYGCADPFAVTEMEDLAVGLAVRRLGLLDRLIILRDSVNMDLFMLGATPESLWNPDATALSLASEDSVEAADIFATAMKNNFAVGSVIIDEILNGGI